MTYYYSNCNGEALAVLSYPASDKRQDFDLVLWLVIDLLDASETLEQIYRNPIQQRLKK